LNGNCSTLTGCKTPQLPPQKKKEEEAVHEIGQIWSGIMRPFDKSGRELSKTPISENVPF
jgi:hypothetical protein